MTFSVFFYSTQKFIYYQDWVRDKRDPWMLASISLVYSKMSREVWNLPPHNTNASESAHANINLDGKSLSLLSAILK